MKIKHEYRQFATRNVKYKLENFEWDTRDPIKDKTHSYHYPWK